ncbi:PKD domain-containing protein [Haloarchaeobius sp. DFWS5]|uniref:PKD domain-containing protein n=1 Tax=Haloarchaeobius sp. DFWS5 TaxID=3446114 RepID=UPI003EB7E30A
MRRLSALLMLAVVVSTLVVPPAAAADAGPHAHSATSQSLTDAPVAVDSPAALAQENTSSTSENATGSDSVTIYGPETAVWNASSELSVGVSGAEIESVTWNLPDGSTASGTPTTYTWQEKGNQTVRVVVETSDGRTLEASKTWDVYRYERGDRNPVPGLTLIFFIALFMLAIVFMYTIGVPVIMQTFWRG